MRTKSHLPPDRIKILQSQSGVYKGNDDGQGATGQIQTLTSPMKQQEVVGFSDQDAGWLNAIGYGQDATMDQVAKMDASLGSFLARPIRIATYTWGVNTPLLQKLNPWKAFFDNPRVQSKIDNFKLARCKLHVKAIISGTGFHYGRVIMAYNPVHTFDQITVNRSFLDVDLVGLSQKPHVFLNPTVNQGGEMCLPFFWTKNYADLTRYEFDDLGELDLKSFGDLLTTNDNLDPVVISIYAWTEELTLTMPTETLVSQSGRSDEFGMGIVSRPASAVAKAAGLLESVPVIGVYARATEMVANAVSGVAQLFGYSRPPIVSDIVQFKPLPQGNLANVDAPDAVQPLSMDSKTELTIDSRTVGLDGVDQMSIKSIVTRESYLTSFQWTQTDAADDLLWNCRVSPYLYNTLQDELHFTPMCLMATMFRYWKGSIKFRFQVVCSDFHKGRMVISFDPNAASVGVQYNTKYNRIIDLATDKDFEIVVGWGQAEPFLNRFEPTSTALIFSDTQILGYNPNNTFNGVLQLNVVNRLVSPATNAPIRVNVYVSMCDDYKFGAPNQDVLNSLSYFTEVTQSAAQIDGSEDVVLESQSGSTDNSDIPNADIENTAVPMEDKPTNPKETMHIADTAPVVDHTYDVFFGESPQSLRDLFKRYTLNRVWCVERGAARAMAQIRNKDLPTFHGYDPNGVDVATNGAKCTVNQNGPLNFFLPCFAGWRGGVRRKYYFQGGAFNDKFPNIQRLTNLNETPRLVITSNSYTTPGEVTKNYTQIYAPRGFNGQATTSTDQNRAIEVQLPYYNNERFNSSRIIAARNLACSSHILYVNVDKLESPDSTNESLDSTVQELTSVGEDFSLFFWTGVPILYNYDVTAM